MSLIAHSRPWITEDDVESVAGVLRTHMLAQGDRTREVESVLSAWVGASGGVAVGSGSAALVLALLGLRVGTGDEVILPTYVCPSVAEAVVTVGATPVLCDVGDEWVITAACAASRLTARTKAIIVPHIYGIFANVATFRELGIPVIEDCAQAVDDYHRRPLDGDAAVFSFHPTKCLTSGEGGLVASMDRELVARMRTIRDGAPGYDAGRLFSPFSDIAAALVLSQLRRYTQVLERRRQLAQRYVSAIDPVLPACLNRTAIHNSMFYRFPILLEGGMLAYAPRFEAAGLQVRHGVDRLLHRFAGLPDEQFPTATRLFHATVSLPIHPALTVEEESRCLEKVPVILAGGHPQ